MKNHRSLFLLLALSGLALIAPQTALTQALFDQDRSFVVARSCQAHTSIKKETAPVSLTVGESYRALGENKHPGGTHAFIEVHGERRWVALGCGHYEGSPPDGDPIPSCLPFFDDQHNPVDVGFGGLADITPEAPQITRFGHAVNAACGEPGNSVSRDEFKALINAHPDVLERIMEFTGGRVFDDRPMRTSTEDYLEDLTDAWFQIHGFDHIICGEPKAGGRVDGFHFHGRYLQLQQSGTACRIPNFRQNEVVPGVIYTMGVSITVDGGVAESPVKGFGLTLSAEDILKVATRAFAENPTSSSDSQGCLLQVSDDNHDFTTVFVRRRNGIRTFFPDATPDPRRNDPCRLPISLPAVDINRAPQVLQPLEDSTAPAGTLTELVIPRETFADPDGDELSLTVTLADGAPIPNWTAFDAPKRTLLLLPEVDQVGTDLRLLVTASDGEESIGDELRIEVVESTSAPIILDVDAGRNTPDDPLLRSFAKGLYKVEPIGRASGGAFDAWAPTGSDGEWRVSYAARADTFVLQVLPAGQHPEPVSALEAANKRTVFALERESDVGFFVLREDATPALGGVSLRVTRIGD